VSIWTDIKATIAAANRTGDLTPMRSPFSSTQLTKIAIQDMAGVVDKTPSRADAMLVPPIVKARSLILLLARHPLALFDTATGIKSANQPGWLTTTAVAQSPRLRNLWTFDDKLFAGLSLWAVKRDPAGQITDSLRVLPGLWAINAKGQVEVGGKVASTEEVILFEGPQEGLVTIGAEVIAGGLAMGRAWANAVQHPIPMMQLHSTEQNADLTDDERDELVAKWEQARAAGGGTAYTPSGIELKTHGQNTADLFIEGRNALRLDVANLTGLPAALLDGSMSTASLTYSTREGQRNELVDLSLAYWAMPFEARLSQDDVCPPGTNIAFDLSQLAQTAQPDHSPNQED
jgi:hypothetical protein